MPNRILKLTAAVFLAAFALAACAGGGRPAAATAKTESATEEEPNSPAAKLRRAATGITKELASSFRREDGVKVAVMPFTEMDGATVTYLGFYLAEKINNELVIAAPNVDVLERSRIEEVLGELELGMSGLLDDASVQEAGRALGADALVVGSLAEIGRRDLPGSEIEVNVRVISVGLMKAVTSSTYALSPDPAIWDMMDRRMGGTAIKRTGGGHSGGSGTVFSDDFKPSTGHYRFLAPPGSGTPMGKYLLNEDAGRLEIRSADNVGLAFQGNLPNPTDTGSVAVTFRGTKVYPTSGSLYIQVASTSGDGYKFVFPKSDYAASINYVGSGKDQLIWDKQGESFDLNSDHTMVLDFSPERLVGTFDGVKVFDVRNERSYVVDTFMIGTGQMDCYVTSLEIR